MGPASRRFARDRLERALLVADPGSTRGLGERLRVLGVSASLRDASEVALPPHAVHLPLVVRDAFGTRRALVRAMIVSFDPSDDPRGRPVLTRSAERAARAGIALAARDVSPATSLERLRLVPVQGAALEDVEIDGPSLGAASYLSARALFSGRRVRGGLAVTGALEVRALAHVDGLEDKLAATDARGLVLIAPRVDVPGDGPGIEGVADVDALVRRALEPGAVDADVEAEVRGAREAASRGWNGYRWPAVRETIARALVRVPDRRPDLRVEVLALLAGAERHLGRTHESLRCVEEGEVILATSIAKIAVPDEPRARLWRQKAMTLLQAHELTHARRAARKSVRIARRARLRGELIASLGAEGLSALAMRRASEAVALFGEALTHTLAHRPSDAARSRAYLVEALGRAGDARGAKREYQLALREAEEDAARGRGGKIEWVRTSYAEALGAMDRSGDALAVLDHPSVITAIAETPLPGLRARRQWGLATIASARSEQDRERGLALLDSSPDAYDGLEPALRATAHVNVLFAVRARLRRGERVDPERLATSLAALPAVPPISRLVTRILEGHGARRLRALDALLLSVERA